MGWALQAGIHDGGSATEETRLGTLLEFHEAVSACWRAKVPLLRRGVGRQLLQADALAQQRAAEHRTLGTPGREEKGEVVWRVQLVVHQRGKDVLHSVGGLAVVTRHGGLVRGQGVQQPSRHAVCRAAGLVEQNGQEHLVSVGHWGHVRGQAGEAVVQRARGAHYVVKALLVRKEGRNDSVDGAHGCLR